MHTYFWPQTPFLDCGKCPFEDHHATTQIYVGVQSRNKYSLWNVRTLRKEGSAPVGPDGASGGASDTTV
jgi:hypothetical protein